VRSSSISLDIDKNNFQGHQNNFVEILKIMSNAAKNFDTLATGLSSNYFDSSTKLLF